MGGKLTKLSQNETAKTSSLDWSQTNGHHDTPEKNLKKKKKISSSSSSSKKVDKSTSIDVGLISPSSSTIKYLVGSSGHPIPENLSYDTYPSHSTAADHPSQDVLELRDACIKRGIISPESCSMYRVASREEVQQSSPEVILVPPTENVPEETTPETPIVLVTNIDEIDNQAEAELKMNP